MLSSLSISNESIDLLPAHHTQSKPDEYYPSNKFRYIYRWVVYQRMEHLLHPVSGVILCKRPAIEGPEESLIGKPHLVKDEMSESAKGKGEEPQSGMVSIEVKSSECDNNEK